MINYTIRSKTKHWPRRTKKINIRIKKILTYRRDLKFVDNINYHCNFILANDSFIKKINAKYKKIRKPTDVLTFVSYLNFKNKKKEKYCDIIFSIDTILKDVKKNNVDFYNHLTHLILHSFLHINNYKHDKNNDFLIMKRKEVSILKKLGIDNPYT